jgi:hypothetical protein
MEYRALAEKLQLDRSSGDHPSSFALGSQAADRKAPPASTQEAFSSLVRVKHSVSKGRLGRVLSSSIAQPVNNGVASREVETLPVEPVKLSPADVDYMPEGVAQPSEHMDGKKSFGRNVAKSDSISKSSFMGGYFAEKKRLRLGELRPPWLVGLVGLPLTFGIGWIFWYRDLNHEVHAHRSRESENDTPSFWWVALPLMHIFMIYRLAISMRDLERENRYESTIPWVAALLACCPPLAVIYLQALANKHWRLHVRFAMAQSTV